MYNKHRQNRTTPGEHAPRRRMRKGEIPVKKLGFGMMRLPLNDPKDQKNIDFDQVCKMVDAFMAKGFTYFDTAFVYHMGESEHIVRRAVVERYPRDKFTVATKLFMVQIDSEEAQEKMFAEQLEKVGVDYFDYYLLHNLNVAHYDKAKKFGSFEFISRKKAEGKIKNIGFSFHDKADLLDEILTAHPEVDFVQLQINYIDWDSDNVQSGKCYDVCVKHGKPVVVMEPIKGGTLAGIPEEAAEVLKAANPDASIASWAIRYTASLDNVMVVLSGMSDRAQVEDNIGYMDDFKPLTDVERAAIAKVVEIINAKIAVPCTSCRYCVDGCPMSIPIPRFFGLYNSYKQFGDASRSHFWYGMETQSDKVGKASACVACGQCESACPQHLEIINTLKDVAALFEVPAE